MYQTELAYSHNQTAWYGMARLLSGWYIKMIIYTKDNTSKLELGVKLALENLPVMHKDNYLEKHN